MKYRATTSISALPREGKGVSGLNIKEIFLNTSRFQNMVPCPCCLLRPCSRHLLGSPTLELKTSGCVLVSDY